MLIIKCKYFPGENNLIYFERTVCFEKKSRIYCFAKFHFNRLAAHNYRYGSIYFSSIVYLLIGCFILSLKYGLMGTVKNVEKRLPTWANFGVIEKPVNRRVTKPFQFRGGLIVSLALGFVEMVIKGLCISYFILGLETYVYRLIRKNARV
ncbi:hypothetical protein II1_04391 [Bacillus cereus MC118]|uniref:Uncharacterized protein n=1 Tax=Bacillus cereus MC67 TaxID=1053219 RepID=J8EAF8_BACCE|nr:hypothetical protein II3_05131 [Bacillus cereus MC67]EOP05704.1 hypothetical protein II1_04391 [Bacillus cereus MC118]